jgi:hypothetical protein
MDIFKYIHSITQFPIKPLASLSALYISFIRDIMEVLLTRRLTIEQALYYL